LNIDLLPPRVDELKRGKNKSNTPFLEEHEVFEKVTKVKKPHSTVPGDVKRVLVKDLQ
jgi:hypothetical protein